MKYEDLRRKILNKPEVKRILKEKKIAFEIADMVLKLRMEKGWTQERLSNRIGTKQPAIARIENGDVVPGLETLEQIAKALGTELILPKFACLIPKENVMTQPVLTPFSYNEFAFRLSQYKIPDYKTGVLDTNNNITPNLHEFNCIGVI